MNTNASDPSPDPIETLLAADVMPQRTKLEEFMEYVNDLKFCRKGSHDSCEPLKALDEALQKAKSLELAAYDLLPVKKGARLSVVSWLFEKTEKCRAWPLQPDECSEGTGFKRAVATDQDLAQYICWKIKELGIRTGSVERTRPDLPAIYWDCKARSYCVENLDGEWQHESTEQITDRLIALGLFPFAEQGILNECSQALLNIRNEYSVYQMVSLAGYTSGLWEKVNGMNILVPSSFNLIEPKKYEEGSARHIMGLLEGLLMKRTGTDIEKSDPYWHFLTHLKNSYLDLKSGQRFGSLAVFLCGPHDSGKSLTLTTIVAPLLGGRIGNAYLYISGQTSFNDELMSKEVWVIDDGVPMSDYDSRKRLGSLLKQAVAGNSVPCHAKGKAMMTVPLYRRLFAALNTDDMESLPPLAESIQDKYMLLKTKRFSMPDDCCPLPEPAGRPAFQEILRKELPFFLDWLLAQDLQGYSSRRFGVRAYKDPELLADQVDVSGLDIKYAVISKVLFELYDTAAVEMTTSEIWMMLMDRHETSLVRETFKSSASLGRALSALAASASHGDLVSRHHRRHGYLRWTIKKEAPKDDPQKPKRLPGDAFRMLGEGRVKQG